MNSVFIEVLAEAKEDRLYDRAFISEIEGVSDESMTGYPVYIRHV